MARVADPKTTVQTISTLIGKDVGLALRVIRTANSARYNRSGRPILTLAHAVALMGMETIRDLAAGLMLLHHFRHRPAGVRQLLALSLLTANHARQGALVTRYPRAEEAYLCGLFRNLGEVLAACYFPDDYMQILAEMAYSKAGEKEAAVRILGFPYEELGQEVVKRWSLPPLVVHALDPALLIPAQPPRGETQHLCLLTGFGHELTSAMHRETGVRSAARLNRLMNSYGRALRIGRESLESIARSSLAETKATFDSLHLPLDELKLEAQLQEALSAQPAEEPAPWDEFAAALSAALPAEGLVPLLTMLLEAARRRAHFGRAAFALVSPGHDAIKARVATSPDLLDAFNFPLDRKAGPLTAALTGRRDLLVYEGPYLASDFARQLGAACFALYPVIVDGVLAGCLYLDAASIPQRPDPSVPAELSRARDLAAQAIAQSRRLSAPAV